MTRCTCLWTAGDLEGSFAVLLADPGCPALAVHGRAAASTGVPGQADPTTAPPAAAPTAGYADLPELPDGRPSWFTA